ncbi:hypothetical protein B0H16DRAFT_200045 [Mycena metata]|uniref:Uncharacterized protein n=1 Tax=Mycena metata TaxID=1033252 RepID=A0AAD7MSW9_9AGAR|nr:hypothetical protein B0H16DRAFT_200045 [Mycena metata]
MTATEATPLLAKGGIHEHLRRKGFFSPYRRVLLATFLLSTTFAFTATPLYYAYRIFNCQEYYDDPAHPPYEGDGDACAIRAIESGTAKDIALMITLTTFSGTLNLIVTTWQLKNWGLRKAIVNQTVVSHPCSLICVHAGYRSSSSVQILPLFLVFSFSPSLDFIAWCLLVFDHPLPTPWA